MVAKPKLKQILVIVGETASGKSKLALQLASIFNGEIICADSWTVRREMNIGTAKPSIKEQLQVPHHMPDLVNPDEDFTAAVFKKLTVETIDQIHANGRLPILVGGTGLYIDSLIYDYSFLPHSDRKLRAFLNNLDTGAILELAYDHQYSLEGIDVNNKRRLIRLIESKGERPTKQAIRGNTLIIGLKSDHDLLKKNIEKRVDLMISSGLEREVYELAHRYGWQSEGMKGVGYAQWQKYFESEQSIEQVRQSIIKATLDLAKRQRTWFKRNKSIHWFENPADIDSVVEFVTTFLDA